MRQCQLTFWLCNVVALYFFSHVVCAQTLNDPNLRVAELVGGLNQPTAMAFIGANDLLVLQKGDGRVRRIINRVLQPGSVLDVNVDNTSERGLLGIAVHFDFPATPLIYIYYTESSVTSDTSGSPLANRVYRYVWNGTALVNPQLILDLPVTPGPNHDGGAMTFGPDGKLYVVIGDLNREGQLQNFVSGPSPDNTSVIFRVNDDGSTPADNPFFSQADLSKYYAYGIRNSFGLAFDPVTGDLWDTENGPDAYDEINLVRPGFNSGWKRIMGPASRDAEGTGDLVQFPGSGYADPKFSWHPVGPTAITFLNSTQLRTQYANDIFVGDINNGNLYHFKPNSTRNGLLFQNPALGDLVADDSNEMQELIFGTGFGGITDLKVGPDGLLYVLSFIQGKIFVISRATLFVPSNAPLVNLSTRAPVQTEDGVMIGGFIIDGAAPKTVLIRGRGSSMSAAPLFVPGVLADPVLRLFSGQTVIAENNNWQDAPNCGVFSCGTAAQITATGMDPCQPNPGQSSAPAGCAFESAILITLNAGAYTVHLSGANGTAGIGLIEIFEADASDLSQLVNLSTRARAQLGDAVMIGGFIIDGTVPKTVLIRGRGPSMSSAPFFVPGVLADPFLRLFSGQSVIAENNNWQDSPSCSGASCGTAAQIAALGMDPCRPNPGQPSAPEGCDLEAAILITLNPGVYTTHLGGTNGLTGIGLVEIFQLQN